VGLTDAARVLVAEREIDRVGVDVCEEERDFETLLVGVLVGVAALECEGVKDRVLVGVTVAVLERDLVEVGVGVLVAL
jgi:hypothetical protein